MPTPFEMVMHALARLPPGRWVVGRASNMKLMLRYVGDEPFDREAEAARAIPGVGWSVKADGTAVAKLNDWTAARSG